MGKCKVLIVDDELLIRQGIKHYVQWEEEGFEIVGEANNGKEALQLIQATTPHIVITDIVMPIMDGEELTRIIKSDYPTIQVIILSSFSDFEYVRSTFQNGVSDYILKPTLNGDDLLKALKKAANSIPNFQLNDQKNVGEMTIEQLIQRLLNEQETSSDQTYIDTHFKKEQFVLLHLQSTGQEQIEEVKQQLPLLNEELVKDMYLLHFNSYEWEQVINKVKILSGKYENVYWTVGSPFSDLHILKNKYEEELLPLLDKRFYFPNQRFLIANPIKSNEDGANQTFDLDQFIRLFKHEQFTDALSYLETYIASATTNQTMDGREFKSFLGNIMFNITVLLANLNYENKYLEKKKYQYLNDVSEAKDVHMALDVYRIFMNEVQEIIANKREDNSGVIKEIVNYIQVHYQKPLTLKEIAEHFHFNPSYLSAYFSANYRVGLNDYIHELRMEKAKQLLTESTYKISDISGEVGYSDHSYFCKVFKQEAGVSPSQYRRKYKKK